MASQVVTCRIVVTNLGPDKALNVTITNRLPAVSTVFSVSLSQGSIFTNSGVLRFAAGDLAPGSFVAAEVKFFQASPGFLTNSAECASTSVDPIAANNVATSHVQVGSPTFVAAGQLLIARSAHTATLLGNGRVLVTGGHNASQRLASVELFDPSTGTSALIGDMLTPRYAHTATLLPNGKVLIAGHSYEDGMRLWTELYDPVSNTLSQSGDMNVPRTLHAASLLPNGTVLIAGGALNQDAVTAEIFEPASARFSPTAPLRQARLRHTATTLPDGRILILGGEAGPQYYGQFQNSAEIYDPSLVLAPPCISISDAAASEDAPGALEFAVSLSAPMAVPVSFNYSLSIGSAWWDEDFQRTNGVLTFIPGTTTLFLRVPVIPDSTFEADEVIFVTISNATNAVIARSKAAGTILSDDPVPTVNILPAAVTESNLLRSQLRFPAVLSNPSYQPVDVAYEAVGQTAVAGEDFEPLAGVLTFNPGVATQFVTVQVIGDIEVEPNELFTLRLSSPTNGVIGVVASGTILNDDGLPGDIHHFDFGPLEPLQHHSSPFPLTVTARDFAGTLVDFNRPVLLRAPSPGLTNWFFTMETDLVSDWPRTNFTYLYGYTELKPYDVAGRGTLSMALRIVPSYGKNGGVAREVLLSGGAKYSLRADLAQANENMAFSDNRFDYTLKIGGAIVGRLLLDQLGRLAPGQIERRVLTGEFTAPTNGVYTLEFLADTSFPASHSAIYVDNLRIESPGVSPALVFLTNGLWSGRVTLPGVGTNLVLQAIDDEGHTGISTPFQLDPSANVSAVASADGTIARTFALCPWTLRVANAGTG